MTLIGWLGCKTSIQAISLSHLQVTNIIYNVQAKKSIPHFTSAFIVITSVIIVIIIISSSSRSSSSSSLHFIIILFRPYRPAQLDARPTGYQEAAGSTPVGSATFFVEIDHEIFSTVILSLPLIQAGLLSVSGVRMCTIPVNRLED